MKPNKKYVVIGITGGVGAGKSTVVSYLGERYGAEIFTADLIGRALEQPGEACYSKITELFGDGILDEDGNIVREKLSAIVFSDPDQLAALDSIVHPAVRGRIEEEIEKRKGTVPLFVIEAALLIEAGYGDLCDEIWYVYADEKTRTGRLLSSRDYTPGRIRQIMDSQQSEEAFRSGSDRVIDNSGSISRTRREVDRIIEKVL